MVKVEFSNKITRGCMLVDEGWYNSHSQVEDSYELFKIAKDDEDSKICLLYIMDIGETTIDYIKQN